MPVIVISGKRGGTAILVVQQPLNSIFGVFAHGALGQVTLLRTIL